MTNLGISADNLRLGGADASQTDTSLGSGPALLIAVGGLDPSGGAGVVRDLLTARTFGAEVRLVATAWTEQAPATGVASVEPRDPARLQEAVGAAWRTAAREGLPCALKVGMLPDGRAAGAILAALDSDRDPGSGENAGAFAGPFVLDPVLGASSGGVLFQDSPAALLPLVARATLVTPNVPELAALLGLPAADLGSLDDVARAGRALLDRGARAVLVKGGHLSGGDAATDTLVTAMGTRLFQASRHPGPDVRGTGCALGAAIAVGLGRGMALEAAIAAAKGWLRRALERAVPRRGEWHID